jgi:type IV pilus assembly protein PilQ
MKKFIAILGWLVVWFFSSSATPEVWQERNPFLPVESGVHPPSGGGFLYQQNKVSLNYDNISIVNLLQLLCRVKHLNLVLNENVTGTITIHLNQIDWNQALNIILNIKQLDRLLEKNILYVAPVGELPRSLLMWRVDLHYLSATIALDVLQNKFNNLLEDDVQIVADLQNNALIIRGNRESLVQIQQFLQLLDLPKPQVIIAAKIIDIDEDEINTLGLKFGTVTLSENMNSAESNALQSGHLAVNIASFDQNTRLQIQLDTLVSQGRAHIISTPRLMTQNHQTATIESGQEIPYQEKTSSGATNIAFKKAVLSLKVTPEIINQKVLLDLSVSQDKISALSVNGVPAIDTEAMNTQVMINNQQTVVLGGIYQNDQRNQEQHAPVLDHLPFIGKIFHSKEAHSTRRQLLIIVTPSIVKSDGSLNTGDARHKTTN